MSPATSTSTIIIETISFSTVQNLPTERQTQKQTSTVQNSFIQFLRGPGKYVFVALGALLVLCLAYILRRRYLLTHKAESPSPPSIEHWSFGNNDNAPMSRVVNMEESPPSAVPLIIGSTAENDSVSVQGTQQHSDTLPHSRPHPHQSRDRDSVSTESGIGFAEPRSSFDPEDDQTIRRSTRSNSLVPHISQGPLQVVADRPWTPLSRHASSLYPVSTLPEYASRCSGGTCPAYSDISRNTSVSTYGVSVPGASTEAT